MAHKAIITIAQQDMLALEFLVSFKQAVNNQGKPASGVYLGDFYLILEGGSDFFFEWLVDEDRLEKGTIKTYHNDQAFLTYDFENAFVTDVSESYFDNTGAIKTQFNQVSAAEDLSEDAYEYGYNASRLNKQDNVLVRNMWKRVRKFQERTGIPYCLFVTMSCEKIKLRDIPLDNEWGGTSDE
ncbi:type VI secretion system tube protein TssD [Larkinella sp. VNQ87]|uniref:type VI secretion system tube protein TssD n=1 Tax=Larkinella sp. VNQ87 TaxID=3400921 RepID=UPI003C087FC8